MLHPTEEETCHKSLFEVQIDVVVNTGASSESKTGCLLMKQIQSLIKWSPFLLVDLSSHLPEAA